MPSSCQANDLHFVLFPQFSQGHMIPMIDFARILAQHGARVTLVSTPLNVARIEKVLNRAISSGLPIQVVQLQFPWEEAGLPEGCESLELISSPDLYYNFYNALCCLMQEPAEKLFASLTPRPNCIVSDISFPWTVQLAKRYRIPRISFKGFSCFSELCLHNISSSKVTERIASDSEYFVIPGMPGSEKFEVIKPHLPSPMTAALNVFNNQMIEAEKNSDGMIINTFEEMEQDYVKAYKKIREDKVWCVGPVSLCNKQESDKAERGNVASIDEQACLKWLGLQNPNSVIYVCLGSLCNLIPSQLVELGLGLEASKKPFIWVVRGTNRLQELDKWMKESGFEERNKERGLVIRGWSPQVLILSHPAIGGFLTHCGWNSTLEAICAGVPTITWPLFAEQFLNEKFILQVLHIGVSLGVQKPMKLGEEEKIDLLKREDIANAIEKLMEDGEEGKQRRKKAKDLGEMAKKSAEEWGSSHGGVTKFMHYVDQFNGRSST